ncbi:hypothetical protein EXU57_19615 [Segetibacter sp. 3557_3]|uniref:hypothetical protein n=1 Tax=Segetibacter sp. 3557_3 TaxID=2547429 RepID=UPI00105911F5|nr:hypothetical protein [Segetibacter sp. 3557_3]TDH21409.1 hypothetical protein EXU57_19615 [Segetibacter sp. 3557_3]
MSLVIRTIASLACCFALVAATRAQTFQPIFEDADGKTAIIAPQGFFGINTANSSLRFQYYYAQSAAPAKNDRTRIGRWNRFYCGVDVRASAESGLSNLFSNGTFTPGTSGDLLIGHRSLLFGTVDRSDRSGETVKYYFNNATVQDWFTLRLGLKAAKYKLYDETRPFEQQLATETFRGQTLQVAYTVLVNGATSIGLSWDNSKVNNIDDLGTIKYNQARVTSDPSGQTVRTFEREVTAFTGNYDTYTLNTYSLDLVHVLTQNSDATRYAFHLFGRRNDFQQQHLYKAGVGFYAFPKGKLFGGVFFQSDDLTNKLSPGSKFIDRVNLGLTVKLVLPTLGQIAR